MKRKIHFNFFAILLVPAYGLNYAYAQDCTFNFEVNSDTGVHVHQVELNVFDRDRNQKLQTSTSGSTYVIQMPEHENMYNRVEIDVSSSDQLIAQNSLAIYHTWPCTNTARYLITISERNGSASEVAELWDNGAYIAPVEFNQAAVQYAQALSTSLKRYSKKNRTLGAYDLISSYITLRAFNNLNNLSSVPLTHSESLRKIATWHSTLLKKVKVERINIIYSEGDRFFSEFSAAVSMYRKYWNTILSNRSDANNLARLTLFLKAIQSENEKEKILIALNLTEEEIINSTSNIAALIRLNSTSSSDVFNQMYNEHILNAKNFIEGQKISNSEKMISDVKHLERIF